jgi:hypothetical protein
MFGSQRRRDRESRRSALLASASGPVDIDGIRSAIGEVLATLPADAVEVRESRERVQSYPGRPDLDLDCLQFRIVPRAAGALDMTIDVFDEYGGVNVFVGDEDAPRELTAPININEDPPRPFLDVIRELTDEVSAGEFDVGTWPGGDSVAVSYWSEEGRKSHGEADEEGITWRAGAPWS